MRWPKIGILVVVTVLVIGLVISWRLRIVGFAEADIGEFCVQCGAERFQKFSSFQLAVLEIPLGETKEVRNSPLTDSWAKYCGGCSHDWMFNFAQRRGVGGKYNACNFTQDRYPPTADPEKLNSSIELLPTPENRVVALRAIGNTNNFLRIIAARKLRDLRESNPAKTERVGWWNANSNLFNVETNAQNARRILSELEKQPDADTLAIEMTELLIDRAQFKK